MPLDQKLTAIELLLATLDKRMVTAHPVSGLPLREALLERMQAEPGILGAVALRDFDRLTAFDPALGDRVFAVCAARLRAMLPASRFAAQVDRGYIGVWFTGNQDAGRVRAELDAIAYALSDDIVENAHSIMPQIDVRIASYDPQGDLDAPAFLSRTLASFATSAAPAATVDPAAAARDTYRLEQDLRQAIARRELRLEFQPLVDVGQARICGAEALIRWTQDARGVVSPAHFIPIAEEMGLVGEIGTWALNTALRAARDWADGGLADLRVAVNVSARQLERDDLPGLVQRTLVLHGLSSSALEIELTESVATSDAVHCRRIFQELRALGVKLAVDDFGTGYSGFASLRDLAFDKIKIDRAFVADVDTRRDSQAICQSIIALGRGLGIRVLAEGVERRGEYEWLRRHGCCHFQGYYFGRPMAAADFAVFARDTATLTNLLATGMTPGRIAERLRA